MIDRPTHTLAASHACLFLDLLQDAQARILRALEAIIDGELGLAERILDDLLADLDRALGQIR